MVAVQLLFPPLVGFAFTYALIEPARALDLPFARLWPHGLADLAPGGADDPRRGFSSVLDPPRGAPERHALAAPLRPSFGGAALLAQHGAVSPSREGAADAGRQPAIPADGGGRARAGAVLRGVCHERVLSALQHRASLRSAQLHRRQCGDAPLASLARAEGVERQLRQHGRRVGRAVRDVVSAGRSRDRGPRSAGPVLSEVVSRLLRAPFKSEP